MKPRPGETHCVTCGERITTAGWRPFCCEVCFDVADAESQRLVDHYLRPG